MSKQYIATAHASKNDRTIYGLGDSPEAAIRDAGENGAVTVDLVTWPASAELAALVEANGGAGLPWLVENDVAIVDPEL